MHNLDTDTLIAKRNAAAASYYGTGESVMTDDAFDALTAELARRGISEQIGHGISGGKIPHTRPMLSLKKVHTANQVANWAESVRGPIVVEPKYDGLAASLIFDRVGKLARAVTRGDGEKGDDITRHVRGILTRDNPIGDTIDSNENGPEEREIRGEIVLMRTDFRELNDIRANAGQARYANRRNAAAGMIGLHDHNEAAAWLTFVQFDSDWMIEGAKNSYNLCVTSPEFADLVPFGVTAPGSLISSTVEEILTDAEGFLTQMFDEEELPFEFPVDADGVVFKALAHFDRDRLGESRTAPHWALAYKFPNRPKHTVLRAVEWTETRTGRVVPTAVFDPVQLSGAIVGRATLNNVSFVEELDVWIGDTIEVTRANEVIPNVVRRIGDHAAGATPLEVPTGYLRKGRDLVHRNRDVAKEICFAASKLDILGLGEDVVRRLLITNVEITDFPDLLLAANIGTILPFERGTQKLVGKLTAEIIAKSTVNQDPAKWIAATGVTDLGVRAGKRIAHAIASTSGTAMFTTPQVAPHSIIPMLSQEQLLEIDGFGESMVASILNARDSWNAWGDKLSDLDIQWNWDQYRPQASLENSLPLAGRKVLVTGTLPTLTRLDAEARIEELGGTVASSVSKSLDMLVAGERAGSKLEKAISFGIDVMTGAEFEGLDA